MSKPAVAPLGSAAETDDGSVSNGIRWKINTFINSGGVYWLVAAGGQQPHQLRPHAFNVTSQADRPRPLLPHLHNWATKGSHVTEAGVAARRYGDNCRVIKR